MNLRPMGHQFDANDYSRHLVQSNVTTALMARRRPMTFGKRIGSFLNQVLAHTRAAVRGTWLLSGQVITGAFGNVPPVLVCALIPGPASGASVISTRSERLSAPET